jgi:hypothetical protein
MKFLQVLWLIISAVILASILGVCLLMELFIPLLATHPQAYVVLFLFGIGMTYPTFRKTATRKISIGILAVFTIGLLSLNFTPFLLDDDAAKPFRFFYQSVHPFMNLAEVEQSLDRHFPTNGAFPKPVCRVSNQEQETSFRCQLDPNRGKYNAEFISVYFKHDRVIRKDYSPD